MSRVYPVTLYENQFKRLGTSTTWTWEDTVSRCSEFPIHPSKDHLSCFGAYRLCAPAGPCPKPSHPKGLPHRCKMCVAELSMAVFDADKGDAAEVEACRAALRGVKHLWYSSHSYVPGNKHKYRLIIPLVRSVPHHAWWNYRAALITRFRIPCDDKSKDTPHLYKLPHRPTAESPTFFAAEEGEELDPGEFATRPELLLPPVKRAPRPEQDGDLERLRAKVEDRIKVLEKRGNTKLVGLLRLVLAGEPLAEDGGRHDALTSTCMALVYADPDASTELYEDLLRPSVDAMGRPMSEASELLTSAETVRDSQTLRPEHLTNAYVAYLATRKVTVVQR